MQKQKVLFAIRLHAVGGDLCTEQLRCISDVAEQFGQGAVHITSRQGIEIPNVKKEDLAEAQKILEAAGISMGADGNRVRVVIACPGETTCRYGSIDTRSLANELDRRFFRVDTPYKIKMGVTGCPNNCGKARESDIGVMGSRIPEWDGTDCIHCNLCVKLCAVGAIEERDGEYIRDSDKCINCSACSTRCPSGSWKVASKGYTVLIGGTLGKRPRLGSVLAKNVVTEADVLELVAKTICYYQENGQPRERLGHLIDRLGLDQVRSAIL